MHLPLIVNGTVRIAGLTRKYKEGGLKSLENERMIIQFVLERIGSLEVADLKNTLELSIKLIDGLGYYDADKALKIIFAGGEKGAE